MTARTANKQKRLKAGERRQTILNAALELFIAKGYATTRMEEIAEAAGCSTGPLYHFFKTKSEVYDALMEVHFGITIGQVHDKRDAIVNDSPIDRLKNTVETVLSNIHIEAAQMFIRESANIVGEKAWRETIDKLMLSSIEQDLREAMIDNLIDPEPPQPLAQIITAAILMAIERADNGTTDFERSKNAILRMVDRMVVQP